MSSSTKRKTRKRRKYVTIKELRAEAKRFVGQLPFVRQLYLHDPSLGEFLVENGTAGIAAAYQDMGYRIPGRYRRW